MKGVAVYIRATPDDEWTCLGFARDYLIRYGRLTPPTRIEPELLIAAQLEALTNRS